MHSLKKCVKKFPLETQHRPVLVDFSCVFKCELLFIVEFGKEATNVLVPFEIAIILFV